MMIPKIIHLIWFGNTQKNKLVQDCILSWKTVMPDWEIKEWTEENYPIHLAPQWVQEAYKEKKWAFVSDYARIDILKQEGGVYLDTDMFMLHNLEPLRTESFFIGKEDSLHLSAGVIGCIPNHTFINDVHMRYSNLKKLIPIPKILSEVFATKHYPDMCILETPVFYPFSQSTISTFNKKNAPKESLGVHMWNYSWGPWYARTLHTFPFYHAGKKILTKLGIKTWLKKILKMP